MGILLCGEEGIIDESMIPIRGILHRKNPQILSHLCGVFLFYFAHESKLPRLHKLKNPYQHTADGDSSLRRGRDSNPRYPLGVYTLSRRAPSTTRPPLQWPTQTLPKGGRINNRMLPPFGRVGVG